MIPNVRRQLPLMNVQRVAAMICIMTQSARQNVMLRHAIMTMECVFQAKIVRQENIDQEQIV